MPIAAAGREPRIIKTAAQARNRRDRLVKRPFSAAKPSATGSFSLIAESSMVCPVQSGKTTSHFATDIHSILPKVANGRSMELAFYPAPPP
jgi:hypothetical protein